MPATIENSGQRFGYMHLAFALIVGAVIGGSAIKLLPAARHLHLVRGMRDLGDGQEACRGRGEGCH